MYYGGLSIEEAARARNIAVYSAQVWAANNGLKHWAEGVSYLEWLQSKAAAEIDDILSASFRKVVGFDPLKEQRWQV